MAVFKLLDAPAVEGVVWLVVVRSAGIMGHTAACQKRHALGPGRDDFRNRFPKRRAAPGARKRRQIRVDEDGNHGDPFSRAPIRTERRTSVPTPRPENRPYRNR